MKKIAIIIGCILVITIQASFLSESLIGKKEKNELQKLPLPHYESKKFDLQATLKGFSKKQIDEHKELYQGYVNKRNEITERLQDADRSPANKSYSSFRALKTAETFAMNGDILHRLYFQNMGSTGKKIGPKTEEYIIKNFGSVGAFKEDLFATAKAARGWAVTAFTPDDGRINNFLFDTHNQKVPALAIPILVLDVYEHAYMIDFGIKVVSYLDVFWDNINWDVIEQRMNFIDKYHNVWSEYFID